MFVELFSPKKSTGKFYEIETELKRAELCYNSRNVDSENKTPTVKQEFILIIILYLWMCSTWMRFLLGYPYFCPIIGGSGIGPGLGPCLGLGLSSKLLIGSY